MRCPKCQASVRSMRDHHNARILVNPRKRTVLDPNGYIHAGWEPHSVTCDSTFELEPKDTAAP